MAWPTGAHADESAQPETTAARPSEEPTVQESSRPEPGSRLPAGLRKYLSRPLMGSARHLDHGVLMAGVAGGWPHLYRLELGLGLLDHLTVGATAHWVPDQSAPRWSPKVAIAFYRWRRAEIGAHYFQSLYPPPVNDLDPSTPSYQRRNHWFLASASFSQAWLAGGVDVGLLRALEDDPALEPEPNGDNPTTIRHRLAGGVHLRGGTRRWGFTGNFLGPHLHAELVFDLRFGLFEARPRGGWRPSGIVYATDRRVPRRNR